MKTQIFYNPVDGQVMAFYRNCRYGGNAWQALGYLEATAEDMPISRNMTAQVSNGRVVGTSASPNPVRPDNTPTAQLPPTQKMDRFLQSVGMTREELKAELGITPAVGRP